MSNNPSFDRVRPRSKQTDRTVGFVDGESQIPDREGKRALFSSEPAPPTLGSVAMVCNRCETRSVLSWSRALRLAFPSVPALVPGNGVRVWMRCGTCERRSWVDLSLN
jgi:hypothetical protein